VAGRARSRASCSALCGMRLAEEIRPTADLRGGILATWIRTRSTTHACSSSYELFHLLKVDILPVTALWRIFLTGVDYASLAAARIADFVETPHIFRHRPGIVRRARASAGYIGKPSASSHCSKHLHGYFVEVVPLKVIR